MKRQRAFAPADRGLHQPDVGHAVPGHIVLEIPEDGWIRLEGGDAGLGIHELVVQHGHADVSAAIENGRRRRLRLEMVDAVDEDILVLHEKVGAVVDAY